MRRPHLLRVGAATLLALMLTGCGDGTGDTPAPPDPAPTTNPSVVDTDETTATEAATDEPDTTTDTGPVTEIAPTTSGPTTDDPEVTQETAAPSEPTDDTAPTAPVSGACTDDSLSQDILGFTGGVSVDFCEGGWAAATYPDAPGTPEFIAETADGRWFHAVSIGDPVCPEDLTARGAPSSIAELLPSCGADPTSAPPTPTDPDEPCTVQTALYGPTTAELIGVSCSGATAEWQVAEANTTPSWTIPGTTPTGWECYVTPYDETSAAAGSCYGPDGSSYFTLYVP